MRLSPNRIIFFIATVFIISSLILEDSYAQNDVQKYSGSFITAKGSGLEPNDPTMPQAEKALLAKRAAKLDALRNLAEQLYGVKITSDSYVRDFVLQSDEIKSRVNTFIQGARVVSEKQMPDGSYQIEVELDTELLKDIIGIR